MMVGISRISIQKLSFRSKPAEVKRKIIIGLKPDNHSREILLRFLTLVVKPHDYVLAIHVRHSDDTFFDPNTFHIHEDLCKSKQVDFQIKVCTGDSYIAVLTNQVRLSYATILALGSRHSRPNISTLKSCLKEIPPTCTLLVINNDGRVLLERQGTSQQGSKRTVLRQPLSTRSYNFRNSNITNNNTLQKSFTAPSSSTVSPNNSIAQRLSERLSVLETEGYCRKHFSPQELRGSTADFSPAMAIGEDANSTVYRAFFRDGRFGAAKVLKPNNNWDGDEILREIALLSRIKHENVAEVIGFCDCEEVQAIVYGLSRGNLRQYLSVLSWSERMNVALGVAKALNYLHHCCESPVVHGDLNSSNILISDDFQPQLSNFGSTIVVSQSHRSSTNVKLPQTLFGNFGCLAPEYMMYGIIDEKTDVYAFGLVLLELITGKEANQSNKTNHEALVLLARSLRSYAMCERLADPYLNEDYDEEEMRLMIFAARLCLMLSSSRRPTMKTILRLFEEPDYWSSMKMERDEFLNGCSSNCEIDVWRCNDSVNSNTE